MTSTNPSPRKSRARPRRSVLFASLESGESFYLNPKLRAVKISFCACRPYAAAALSATDWGAQTPWRLVNPFRSVFIDRPVPETRVERVIREANEEITTVQQSGRTHYVGDDCPGGHADKPVNNDNDITGPTS